MYYNEELLNGIHKFVENNPLIYQSQYKIDCHIHLKEIRVLLGYWFTATGSSGDLDQCFDSHVHFSTRPTAIIIAM